MSDEFTFRLNTHGLGGGGIRLSPSQIGRIPQVVYQELFQTLDRLGTVLNFELRFYYYKMIHERPRNPEYPRGRSTPLLERMEAAFTHQVTGTQDAIGVNVFDLGYVDEQTRSEGFNTKSKGWFMRFADGHTGRKHGGVGWGFIEYEFAMRLAREASVLIGDPKKRTLWLMEMATVFKGRHGQGIMVRLDMPLFAVVPEFGKADKFVQPHPGYFSWPALGYVGSELVRRRGWVGDMMQRAFDSAIKKL